MDIFIIFFFFLILFFPDSNKFISKYSFGVVTRTPLVRFDIGEFVNKDEEEGDKSGRKSFRAIFVAALLSLLTKRPPIGHIGDADNNDDDDASEAD